MAESEKYAAGLDLFQRLSLPLRLGIWLVFTLSAVTAAVKFHYPEGLSAELRILLVVAASAALLLVALFHHDDKWYEHLPPSEPVICRSIHFLALGSKSALKKDLIHEYESTVIPPIAFSLSEEKMQQCAGSAWEFDRIVLYLYEETKAKTAIDRRFQGIRREKERLSQTGWRGSLVPLHYSVRSARKGIVKNGKKANLTDDQRADLEEVRRRLNTLKAKVSRAFARDYRGRQIYDSCMEMLS